MPKNITTRRQQYARMLELLQEKPEVAQGFTKCRKEEVTAFWEKLGTELNSLGPPSKDVSTWKKVWLDWKSYIKRKLMENKREQTAKGGGRKRQHSFNYMEKEVIKLTALETCTSSNVTSDENIMFEFAEPNTDSSIPFNSITQHIDNERMDKTSLEPIDLILSGYAKTIKTFSPRMQVTAKFKLAEVMSELEMQYQEEIDGFKLHNITQKRF